MDLIFYSYKSRLRQGWRVILVMSLLIYVAHSWRITQKCPHGHYYNDGCTGCWCDTRTGVTKCERLLQCTRREVVNQVKCPQGRIYKDSCGNDCSCYESTGTVFCNEKRKCPQKIVSNSTTSVPIQTTTFAPVTLRDFNGGNFIRRDGLPATFAPNVERHVTIPQLPIVSSSTYSPIRTIRTANPVRRSTTYDFDQMAVSSTPRPQFRIPPRSEELIIEPAIIVRTKGSNKASVVRNPSSATSVILSSLRRNASGSKPPTLILNKSDQHVSSYPTQQFSASSSVNPLKLYEKQLKTIMNIKRAYAQLLRSKVNFNFQIATGKNPLTQNTVEASNNIQYNNYDGSGLSFDNSMLIDHPRRFDNNYDNSTYLVNTTPSPPVMMTDQNYKSPLKPFFWRKEQIKNALKQFSPVPPLRQLVSYVSTSTESYLSQFLNNLGNKNKQQQIQLLSSPETTTSSPRTIPPPALPTPYYPLYPYSTPESLLDHPYDDQYASISPIHEVYHNHDFKLLTRTTPSPPITYQTYDTFPQHYSNFDKTGGNNYDHTTQFPFMNELMQEIARSDHHLPTATPRSSPGLTAVPTFQTPGPPYAEIDVVQPLSFLPPPDPEPATPTRRTLMMSTAASRHPILPVLLPRQHRPRPTVRVNLDKPIYLPNSPQPNSSQNSEVKPQQQTFFPQQQPFLPQHQSFPPLPQQQSFSPQQQNIFPQQQPFLPQHQGFPPPPQQQRFSPPHQSFPPQQRPIFPQQQTFLPHPPPNRRNHNTQQPFLNTRHFKPNAPIPTLRPLYPYHYHPVQRYPSHKFFIPSRPKQYRLVLKGRLKEAATRVDNVVPQFVTKIAHEFFKKPDIYVPKIRPGMPLTLEKVVLNHKEIVPKEVTFSQAPGAPPTKLRFSPQAHWKMREDLAKQGIMLNEPLHTALRDYVNGDPNVMEMEAPVRADMTWEKHSGMGKGTYPPGLGYTSSSTAHVPFEEAQRYQPILLPSPTPFSHTTVAPPHSLDFQHQQELQHQLLLAQQTQHQQNLQTVAATSGPINNGNSFTLGPSNFNDFAEHGTSDNGNDDLPYQLNIPGVKQVVVDKYMIHDPMDPSGGIQVFSTTTVEPPLEESQNVDLSSILSNQPQQQYNIHRQGLPMFTPTPPPAVLIRHHGAPSPSPPQSSPTSASVGNYFLTVINSTPKPLTSAGAETETGNSFHIGNAPTVVMTDSATGSTSVVSQIHEFLHDRMDFGARPQLNLYDMLFHSRTGIPGHHNISTISNHRTVDHSREAEHHDDDQMATETNFRHEEEDKEDVDTDRLANIFSSDYKHKYNRKPPEVIVIKVPQGHNDGGLPKVVERNQGQEIEIIGGRVGPSKNHSLSYMDSKEETIRSKETSARIPSDDSEEEALLAEITSSIKKRRRNRKGNKRKRKRKKKKQRKNKNKENLPPEDDDPEPAHNPKSREHSYGYGSYIVDTAKNDKDESREDANNTPSIGEAEQKFQSELDWKSQLMANICDLNPSSPLCLTYRSICLLMTSDD